MIHLPGYLKLNIFTTLIFGKDLEDLELSFTVGGCINWIKAEKLYLLKLKICLYHDSLNYFYISKRHEYIGLQNHLQKNVCNSFIYISKLETTQKSN